uniref:Uncharacterized protein n=1 Tax=Cairina moschata TaxID=8855 RepID=A0A8C3BKP8_CAIMO
MDEVLNAEGDLFPLSCSDSRCDFKLVETVFLVSPYLSVPDEMMCSQWKHACSFQICRVSSLIRGMKLKCCLEITIFCLQRKTDAPPSAEAALCSKGI